VASDGGERIDGGERRWSRIDDSDSSFSDNSGYDCSNGGDDDNSDEIQEI